jgi:hypothetical protein
MSFDNASECLNRAMNALTDGKEADALAALSGARLNLEVEEIAAPASKEFARRVMSYLHEARKFMAAGIPNRALECVQQAVQMLDERMVPGIVDALKLRDRLDWECYMAECEAEAYGRPVGPESCQFTEPYEIYERAAEELERRWEARQGGVGR